MNCRNNPLLHYSHIKEKATIGNVVYQIITRDMKNFPNGSVEEIMHQILTDKAYLAENVIVPFDISSIQEQVKRADGANVEINRVVGV